MTPEDPSNPWKTVSTRPIYDNPWISVREDDVIRPDGRPGIYGVVSYKNRAIGVLPVDEAGDVWLVGQYRYTIDEYSWEIPEGGGPLDESPEMAAARELREETGLVAGKLEWIASARLSNSVTDEIAHIYRARELTRGPSDPEGTERLEIRKVPLEKAIEMVESGSITDSITIIALYHEEVRRLRLQLNRSKSDS
jgi:8-oxo-dGTP pyrophosphatase MutT (NUDIX family)